LVDYIEHFALLIEWVNEILTENQTTINSIQDVANGLTIVYIIEVIVKKKDIFYQERRES